MSFVTCSIITPPPVTARLTVMIDEPRFSVVPAFATEQSLDGATPDGAASTRFSGFTSKQDRPESRSEHHVLGVITQLPHHVPRLRTRGFASTVGDRGGPDEGLLTRVSQWAPSSQRRRSAGCLAREERRASDGRRGGAEAGRTG